MKFTFRDIAFIGRASRPSASTPLPDPTADPNLFAWYSADTGFVNNGVKMTGTWADRSGQGHIFLAPGGGLEPLYQATGCGSKPYAQWTGSQFIRTDVTGAYIMAQPFTVYLLIRITSWQDSKVIFDSANVTNVILQMYPSVSGNISMYGGVGYAPTNTTFAFGSTWQIITMIWNGASSSLAINNAAGVTANTGSNGLNGYMLGWYHGGGPYFSSFDLGAMVVSTSANSPSIQSIHRNWLANYASITI